jgi:cyanophycin synthetase
MSFSFRRRGLLQVLFHAYHARDWYLGQRSDNRRAGEHRSAFYAELWRNAAAHLGASIELLGNEILEIRLDQACTRVQQNTTPLDDPVTLSVAGNKPLVHRLLAGRGLRIPTYCEFTLDEIGKAVAFMERVGGEWVVKPANSGGGHGVTTGITRSSDLVRAAAAAAVFSSNLLIEQQVEGDVYRLLYLDGRLLDAVVQKPPVVVADGRTTIRGLVRRENEARLRAGAELAQVLLSIDTDMQQTLSKQGFSLSSVPKKGVSVTLKRIINENSETNNASAKNLLCKSIIEDGAAAAAAVGVRLAGVDLVTREPAIPLAQSGGVILEVNTTPGYHCHYHKQGGGCPVAVHILSCLMRQRQNDGKIVEKEIACPRLSV